MGNDVEKLLELVEKEGVDRFGRHSLDFSREEHRECFYEMFGGRAHMEKEYPDLYALVLQTSQGKKKLLKSSGEGSLENFVMISDAFSDASRTSATGITGLTARTDRLYQSVTLMQDGSVIGRKREFYSGTEREELCCTIDNDRLKSNKDKITCVFTSVWQDTSDGLLNTDTSVTEKIMPYEAFVDGIKLAHPCYYYGNSMADLPPVSETAAVKQEVRWPKSVTSRGGEIRVAYNRRTYTDKIDYIYPEKRRGRWENEVLLDVQGRVILAAGYEYEKLESVYMLLDFVENGSNGGTGGNGAVRYKASVKEGIHIYPFSENGVNGFCFAFPTDWNTTIPDSCFGGNKSVYFEAEIQVKCKDCEEIIPIYISSTEDNIVGKNVYTLPKINLQWGCLEKDVPVKMADGSMKKISGIVPGDEVCCEDGSVSKVTDTICGSEEELIYVKVEGYDSKIGASMTHPFMTEKGSIKACNIIPSTCLKMDDGKYHRIEECYRTSYNDKVYNLVLDGTHWFYGGHFVVGDNVAQGKCEAGARKLMAAPHTNAKVLLEIEKLKREFG